MKRNKSILHLCEVILGVLMLILILNLYLIKLLVDPDISYTPMYRNLCLTLALLVFCMVLALIQRELLARLLNNAYRDVTGIHNKKSLEKKLQELNDRATTFGVGVMMFDLNNLKHVNDTYGHEKGDEFIGCLIDDYDLRIKVGSLYNLDELAVLKVILINDICCLDSLKAIFL